MDPGVGLMIHGAPPTKTEVPQLPPKPKLQLPPSFLEKPHVRVALKHLATDEQREKALEVALAWKTKFATEKWKAVVASIEAVKNEDTMRMSPQEMEEANVPTPPQNIDEETFGITPRAERPRAMTAASAPAVPQASQQMTQVHTPLARQHTATTSLHRWLSPAPTTEPQPIPWSTITDDLPMPLSPATAAKPQSSHWVTVTREPPMPLSPVLIGNSFSKGGYWTPTDVQFEQNKSPLSATFNHSEPLSPIMLMDPEARKIYNRMKDTVETAARKHRLARSNTRASGEDALVPYRPIKPRDIESAASAALDSCNTVGLKDMIIKDLPQKLHRRAVDEAKLRSQYRIANEVDLSEQNDWMNNELFRPAAGKPWAPPVHLAVSILDEHRERARDFRLQRDSVLKVDATALKIAWLLRILEDAERRAAAEADGSSDGGSDDGGYDYGNFLRNIRRELSSSTTSLGSMVDELSDSGLTSHRSRSNTDTTSSSSNGHLLFSPRSRSSSALRERRSTRLSEQNSTPGGHKRTKSSLHKQPNPNIQTNFILVSPENELSPLDRETRRRGASVVDLDYWAQELKKMDATRLEKKRLGIIPSIPNSLTDSTPKPEPTPTTPTPLTRTKSHRTSLAATITSHFSSSSSSDTTGPRPSFSSSDTRWASRPAMLDHEYHQLRRRKNHRQSASLHESFWEGQHSRSADEVSKEAEEEWLAELNRLHGNERVRQVEEKEERREVMEVSGGE